MAVHFSHACLPYPIKGARFSLLVPSLDADGDPTAQTTPDTEVSKDGAAAADAAEEMSTISGMTGFSLMTWTGAELDCTVLAAAFKAASGPKDTLGSFYPKALAIVGSGTLSAGSAGGGTLGTLLIYDVTGCFIKTTGGTGGGGTGGANNQARRIITYSVSTGAFTVGTNWETTVSTDTTYDVLLPDGVTLGMLRTLNPTTAGRTLDVSSGGEAGLDWANVGSPTTTVGLSGTTVKEATDVQTQLDDASVGLAALKALIDDVEGKVDDLEGRLSAARAGYLDNLSAGAVALEATAQGIHTKTVNLPVDPADQSLIIAATDAVIAAIAALNNLSSAQAQAAAAAALTAYDPPTKAELDTAAALLATAANLALAKTAIDAILVDTGTTLDGRLPAALTGAGNMKADALAIDGSTAAAANLARSALAIVRGAAAAGTLSTTQMTTDLTEATNDHYNGRVTIWTSGVLAGQATDITDYDGTTKVLTFTAITEAPSAGDQFVIV